jgi:hypothetical protein
LFDEEEAYPYPNRGLFPKQLTWTSSVCTHDSNLWPIAIVLLLLLLWMLLVLFTLSLLLIQLL